MVIVRSLQIILVVMVEEHELPDQAGEFAEITQRKPPIWSFGQKQGRSGSFYCSWATLECSFLILVEYIIKKEQNP